VTARKVLQPRASASGFMVGFLLINAVILGRV
jgi:hypothetical protein